MKKDYTKEELQLVLKNARMRVNQLNKEAELLADIITKTHNELME